MATLDNMDKETGIRYGVIHDQVVGTAWYENAVVDYGPPRCKQCNQVVVQADYDKHGEFSVPDDDCGQDYACESCRVLWGGEDVFPEEPLRNYVDEDKGDLLVDLIQATQTGGGWDIVVTNSAYYTECRLCSPCYPNAGDLSTPQEKMFKAFCFGHDWFDDKTAPYPVFRVHDDSECFTAKQAVERGAAKLDAVTPDWESKMTGRLDMTSLKSDVLGKVYGSMWTGAEVLFPGIMQKSPKVANDLLAPLGFMVQLDFNNAANYGRSRRDTPDFSDLDKAWLDLVDRRVAARGTVEATQAHVKGLA